jgi:hypothetical protein
LGRFPIAELLLWQQKDHESAQSTKQVLSVGGVIGFLLFFLKLQQVQII